MLLELHPPEIQAPGTPGKSHGTKILGSNFFSYQPLMMLFYEFWGLLILKLQKNAKEGLFHLYLQFNGKTGKYACFSNFIAG